MQDIPTLNLDLDKLPTSFETMEDYLQICEGFAMPFMHQQAEKIADVIEQLQKDIDSKKLTQERLDDYVNQIRSLSAFAGEDNVLTPLFKNLIELEKRLDDAGEFDKLSAKENK